MAYSLQSIQRTAAHSLLEFCFPTRCAGCDAPGSLLCECCLHEIHSYDAVHACPVCAAPYGDLVCTECWDEEFAFSRAVALGAFEPPLSRACVLYKDANEQRLGLFIGKLLGQRVKISYGNWADLVSWVPPSQDALRRRGFDHAALLAKGVSLILNVEMMQLCSLVKSFDMRSFDRDQRREAACNAFTFIGSAGQIREKNIVLIDDVLTTGSTLDALSRVLLDAGAREVRLAVIARTW